MRIVPRQNAAILTGKEGNIKLKTLSPFKKYFEVDFLFRNLLVPVSALIFYCGSFAYLSSQYLPGGVNFVFTSRLWKYLLIVLAWIGLSIAAAHRFNKNSRLKIPKFALDMRPDHLIFLLLPITPVVQYILNN